MIGELKLAWEMGVLHLQVNSYFQLVANQVKGEYQAKEDALINYLSNVESFMEKEIYKENKSE